VILSLSDQEIEIYLAFPHVKLGTSIKKINGFLNKI
jgi:hypothetical protein